MSAGAATASRALQPSPRLQVTVGRILPPLVIGKVLCLGAVVIVAWASTGHPVDLGDLARRFGSWDARSYIDIADHGYPCCVVDYHDAFLPGYPIVTRMVGVVVRDTVLAGLLVSLAAEFVALIYIARLVEAERDQRSAVGAVWCVALAPVGFFLSGVYTESLFIAAVAASLFHARRGEHGRACLAAALACATRITGLVLIPVLVVEWLRNGRRSPAPAVLSTLLVLSPLLAYAWYMHGHVGDALAFRAAQRLPSFNHDLAPPWSGFALTWQTMVTAPDAETRSIFLREIVFGLLGLAACLVAWCWPRFPRSWALYCGLVWVFSTSLTFWLSVPRYLLALFPLSLVLADIGRRVRWLGPGLLVASGALMTWGATLYAGGAWLA